MRIRFFSVAFPLVAIFFVAGMGTALWRAAASFGELERALEQRNQAYSVAADLARLTQPIAPAKSDEGTGAKSLPARFKASGASEEELKLLDEVVQSQQELQQAAAAVIQGLFDPVQGDVAGGGLNPQRKLKALYGPDYEKLQAKLISDVNRLIDRVDARTVGAVQTAKGRLWRDVAVVSALAVALLLLAIAAGLLVGRSVLRPIRRIDEGAARVVERDYTARVQAGNAIAELGRIAAAFNGMAEAVEDDIRTRMQITLDLQKARATVESSRRMPAAPAPAVSEPTHEPATVDPRGVSFDLHDVLSDSVSKVRSEARAKALELSLELDSELARQPYVIGDAARLEEVLANLLSNAVRFTDRGSVRLSVFVLEAHDDELVLCFTVTDTGCGMTEEQTSRLFPEADDLSNRAAAAAGKGLAVSKRLVESMGGDIDVESEPGNGSCFHFTVRVGKAKLPAKVVDISAPRPRPPDSTGGRKRTRGQDG